MNPRKLFWLIIILVILSLFADIPKLNNLPKVITPRIKIGSYVIPPKEVNVSNWFGKFPIKLGLDLQGGSQLVYEAKLDKIPESEKDQTLESVRQVIDRRVNPGGVSEAVVQSAKVGSKRRIIVDLPGAKDASQAAQLVGKTAQLEFRELPELSQLSEKEIVATKSGLPLIYLAKSTGLTGSDLKPNGAKVVFGNGNSQSGGAQVSLQFNEQGTKKFASITKRNVGKQLPIFLDEQILSAPVVQQEILDGNPVISGSFTTNQAKQLADLINGGALKVPIELVEQRSIGASLGQESINKSIIAGAIGVLIVCLYMVLYYGWLGLVADFALIIYSLFVFTIFKTGLFLFPPVTITLPGIAGFILSIGMAVDANILIFERMKEERRWGKSNKMALDLGFKRAWSSIRDSNVSSLITAGILYYMGSGLIKGFAYTLAIGVVVSMFTAITVTRTFLRLIIK